MAELPESEVPTALAITVTVTSFYVPTPTSSSVPTDRDGPSASHFVALAIGATLGGFAVTCLLGWLLFLLWRRRHPHKWHGRRGPDADNFGWRRSTANKLQETEAKSVSEFGLDHASTLNSPPLMSSRTSPDVNRQSWSRETSNAPLLSPIVASAGLLHEYSAAMQKRASDSAGSRSPSSSSSPKHLSHQAVPVPELPANDVASHSSRSSQQQPPSASSHSNGYNVASSSGHSAPVGWSALPSPATMYSKRTPSPTTHRRSGSATGFFSPSSWHGHSASAPKANHSSWHGPLPHQGHRPTSSWNGHPSSLTQPPPTTAWPNQPKFFLQESSQSGIIVQPPSPTPSPPPALSSPRRLTVTNPDLSNTSSQSVLDVPNDALSSPNSPPSSTAAPP